MCSAHATVRGLLAEIVAQGEYTGDILVDMEAGLEHLSRGTGRHVNRVVAVLEPYYRSMETASRVADLAKELGITEVVAVSNKVRDDADRHAIAEFCGKRGLNLIGEVPHDPLLAEAERSGLSPIEHSPDSPSIRSIRALATRLLIAALCLLPVAARAQAPLRLVGRSGLGAAGFNGAVSVVGTTAIVGAGIVPAAGIHAQLYNPLPCPEVSIKVVDLSARRSRG